MGTKRNNILFSILMAICAICGCKQKEVIPEPPPEVVESAKDIQPRVKTEIELLREAISDFVTLAADCDKQWFSDVKPERIDKWELPVNVKDMENQCDRLLRIFEELLDKGAYRCPELDDFLRIAASVADQYLILAYRCKKVGVRDKLPYKKEVAELRDALRAEVSKLKEEVGKVLDMSDTALKGAMVSDVMSLADAALLRLRNDYKQWIETPVKEGKPTWRYSLRTSDTIAARAVLTLRSRAGVSAQPLIAPAEELSRAFTAAVHFYTGNYFDTEEEEGPKLRAAFNKADNQYRQASRRMFKSK